MPNNPNQLNLNKPDSLFNKYREVIAWVILGVDLLVTFFIWGSVNDTVYKDAESRFNFRKVEVYASIKERMMTYEQVLKSGIGLFKASNVVSRKEWKIFVDTLEIESRFPGIQGIGYSQKVSPNEKQIHTQKIRAEGFPDYKIKPEGEREEYHSIVFLEPFNIRNRQAFGYDMFSESVRKKAMEKARDSGETIISGKVRLVQEIDDDVQSGFLVYLPFYKNGMPVRTQEQRQLALDGFVFSPFRMNDLMFGILGTKSDDIDLEVFDGPQINNSTLMYDADGINEWESTIERPSNPLNPLFQEILVLDLYGHKWALRLSSLPAFEATIDKHKSDYVLILGGVFSLLCFVVIHGAFTSRRQSLKFAQEMSDKFKNSEERLNLALEGSNDGLWDWNIETGEVYFSPRWMTMLGFKPAELEGNVKTWEKLVHPDDKPWVMQTLENHLKGKTEFYLAEHRVKTKNGKWKWILDRGKVITRDKDGKPLRAAGTHTDISDRKSIEEDLIQHRERLEELVAERTEEIEYTNEALEKNKAFLTNLISNINGLVYQCNNDRDWTTQFLSAGCASITGYEPDDFIKFQKITFNELIIPNDRERVWEEIQMALEKKKPFVIKYQIKTATGEIKHILERGNGVWSSEGQLESLQGLIVDNTEQVNSQLELEKNQKQIAHTDKLASLGKLVGTVAHEFNNPLYGVINLVDQLKADLSPEERVEISDVASKECWRMAGMIKNLRDFYRPTDDHTTRVDLNEVIDEVLVVFGKDLNKRGIKIIKCYYEFLLPIVAVNDQIKQIILNLIQNSADSMPECGGHITLVTEQLNSSVLLKVKDTGIGIPEEHIKSLFDPFYTTKGKNGTGLGLSVTYGIIKKHGGTIEVESSQGQGTVFTVHLPVKAHP